MKKVILVVSLLVLVVGNGWGDEIVGDTVNGNLTVNGSLEMNKTLKLKNSVRTWILHSDNAPDEFRIMSNGVGIRFKISNKS